MLKRVLSEAEISEEVKLSMSSVGGSVGMVGVFLVAVVVVFLFLFLFLLLLLFLERDFLEGTVMKLGSSTRASVGLVGVTGTGLAVAVLASSAAWASAGVGFWVFLMELSLGTLVVLGMALLRLERRVLGDILVLVVVVRKFGRKGEGLEKVGVTVLRARAAKGLLECLWALCLCR
jgi:hypothetical protein